MDLLGGRYFPITSCFGFLEADLETVIAADKNGRLSRGGYSIERIRGSLPEMLDRLLPLTGPLLRHLWVRTNASWTAYFDNFVNGGDPYGPVHQGSLQIPCRGVMILNKPQTPKSYGGTRFTIFGSKSPVGLNVDREISAINDGGRWAWDQSGDPLPFEETSQYESRRIRDRLTPEMLDRYCTAIGIRAFDDAFYGSEGYLVQNNNIKFEPRTLTLNQAQEESGGDVPPARPLTRKTP
jgi:hypothetical protein